MVTDTTDRLRRNGKWVTAMICLLLAAGMLGLQRGEAQPAEEDPPNIVLIFMDDMGYGDIGSFGGIDYTTPHIDRMAAEGMRFTNFYTASAVCSASRAALMTGAYPNRVGISGALFPGAETGLNPEEQTMAELLKTRGYATAIVGKWHLGDAHEFLPLQHGFDEYFGLPYSNDMWPVNYDGTPATDSTSFHSRMPPLPLIEGNEPVEYIRDLKDQDRLTTRYTNRAVDFIQRQTGPFFLYFAHTMPHVPLGVSDKFRGKSGQGLYGDMMMEVDWSVGRVMQALEEKGVADNTLVVLTSDNGPWLNFGDHAGSAGGLREGKQTSWEGGQRVPAVMRWPATIPAGRVSNKIASTLDLLPTFSTIAGAPMPERRIDGVSILPLLEGDREAAPRDHLYYYYNRNDLEAVRKGKWKLVFPHGWRTYEDEIPGHGGVPGPRHAARTEQALYNLRRDPGERYNVIDRHPEVVEELERLAEQARRDLGDNLTGREGANRREPGRL